MVKAKKKTFLEKKRKSGSEDFGRVKAKVGRKVSRGMNETSTSFSTRQVSLKEQSVLKESGGIRSSRGLTFEEHLVQLGHHNERARSVACMCLRELLSVEAEKRWTSVGTTCLEAAARLLSDESRRVRAEAVALLRATLDMSDQSEERTRTAGRRAAAIVARLGAALASLDLAIRTDASKALTSLLVDGPPRPPFLAAAKASLLGPLSSALKVAKSPELQGEARAYRPRLVKLAVVLLLYREGEACLRERPRWGRALRCLEDVVCPKAIRFNEDIAALIGNRTQEALRSDDITTRVEEVELACDLACSVCARGEPVAILEVCATIRRDLAAGLSRLGQSRVGATLARAAIDETEPAAVDWLVDRRGRPRSLTRHFLCSAHFPPADLARVADAARLESTAAEGDAEDASLLAELCLRDLKAIRPTWLKALCASAQPAAIRVASEVARRSPSLDPQLSDAVAAGLDGLVVAARQNTEDPQKIAAIIAHLDRDLPVQCVNRLLEQPHDDTWARLVQLVALARRPFREAPAFLAPTAKVGARAAFFAVCYAIRHLEVALSLDDVPDNYLLVAARACRESLNSKHAERIGPLVVSTLATDEQAYLALRPSQHSDPAACRAALDVLANEPIRLSFLQSTTPPRDALLAIARVLRDPHLGAASDIRAAAARLARDYAHHPALAALAGRLDALVSSQNTV